MSLLDNPADTIYVSGSIFDTETVITISDELLSNVYSVNGQVGNVIIDTGSFITSVDLSGYATIANLALTGSALQSQINNLDLNYASDLQLSQTGSALQSQINNLYNSGFITGVNLSPYATNANLAITGLTLNTKIDNLSGVSVLTYGNQTIGGIKTFKDAVYIGNLYVTGVETIVNTQNFNVQSPYLLLNLTGGATDGGIFFVTGSGLTGINEYGPIIGFDHSNKFKFGVARRSDDLSSLNDIASIQNINNYSGFVTNNFYPRNNPSGFITGIGGIIATQIYDSTAAGRALLTGATVQQQRTALDIFVTATNTGSFPVNGNFQRVYIARDTSRTYAWNGSSYIETSPSVASVSSGVTISSGINGNFSNLEGLIKNAYDEWWNGVPFGWSGVNTDYTIRSGLGTNNYVANIGQLSSGPSGNSFRQNLGKLPITSNVELTFTYSEPFNDAILNAVIYDGTYVNLATGQYTTPGTYTLTGTSIPANTNIIIGFWSPNIGTVNPGLDNVSVSQTTSATTWIFPTNLPRNSDNLPSGALWVDTSAGNVLKIVL